MAKRGIQVTDVPSSLSVIFPVPSAHIVAIGAAPVDTVPGNPWNPSGYASVVNVATLTEIPSDFTTQLGFSTTFGPGIAGAYSLAEVYDAAYVESRVSPVTCINVYDPYTMSTPVSMSNQTWTAQNTIPVPHRVIYPSLVVKGATGTTYKIDIDYTFKYDDDTTATGTITGLAGSPILLETNLTITFSSPNLAAITRDLVIGGVDTAGNKSGLAVLEDVFTVTDYPPALVITPGFGHDPEVIAAANAAVQNINNGRFRALYIGDIDALNVRSYSGIFNWLQTNNAVSSFERMGWPAGALGSKRYHASTLDAVMFGVTDNQFSGIPYCSNSNKNVFVTETILWDGTPITINPTQADAIEEWGGFTFINYPPEGWVTLGDYTCAVTSSGDPVNFWSCFRRMWIWLGNTFSRNFNAFIDQPGNLRSLSTIVNSANQFLNTIVQAGAAWTARMSFNPDENPIENVVQGIYTFHVLWSPPTPIRTMDILIEYDVQGQAAAIKNITLISS
jgi:phage tail sheath protein FI